VFLLRPLFSRVRLAPQHCTRIGNRGVDNMVANTSACAISFVCRRISVVFLVLRFCGRGRFSPQLLFEIQLVFELAFHDAGHTPGLAQPAA
jgi:hypothetical protein